MLEFIRSKQGPMWIVVTIVVIISFTFWGGYTQSDSQKRVGGPEDTAFTLYGKNYTFSEFERLSRFGQLAMQLSLPAGDAPGGFTQSLATVHRTTVAPSSMIPPDFVFNLLILRREVEKLGIQVSDDEVREAFKTVPALLNEKGVFDPAQAEFFENSIGSLGFRTNDLYDLLRDWVGFRKLQTLVTGNFIPSPKFSTEFYTAEHQTIKVTSVPFLLETYKAEAKVSDEELQKYYDENKDRFLSDELRGVTYAFFPSPDVSKLSEEEAVKARNAYGEKVNNFSLSVIAPDANFEELAKAAEAEVKTLAPFKENEAPAEIKEEFQLVGHIFRNDREVRPVSDPVDGIKGYYIFKVTEVVAPKQQELKEVEPKVREALVNQKATEALTKAANDAKQKLDELIKGGKSFADAVKEAGLKTEEIAPFTRDNPPMSVGQLGGRALAEEARGAAPGTLTKPLATDTGLILVYVNSKELYKSDDAATKRDQVTKFVQSISRLDVFGAWFSQRHEEARLDSAPFARAYSAQ